MELSLHYSPAVQSTLPTLLPLVLATRSKQTSPLAPLPLILAAHLLLVPASHRQMDLLLRLERMALPLLRTPTEQLLSETAMVLTRPQATQEML